MQLSQGKNMLARQKSEVGFPTGPTRLLQGGLM
jgi:hypothetical protein